MKISNKKILEALEAGYYITSPKMPKHVYLRLRNGELELIDWGQKMNCMEFLFNNFIGLMRDSKFYICDEFGNKR